MRADLDLGTRVTAFVRSFMQQSSASAQATPSANNKHLVKSTGQIQRCEKRFHTRGWGCMSMGAIEALPFHMYDKFIT